MQMIAKQGVLLGVVGRFRQFQGLRHRLQFLRPCHEPHLLFFARIAHVLTLHAELPTLRLWQWRDMAHDLVALLVRRPDVAALTAAIVIDGGET